MEYIILWMFALFGVWSLISNILESFYYKNVEGCFDVILTVCNQEDNIYNLIYSLSKIELIGTIKVYDNNSTDGTVEIIKTMQKNNSKIVLVEDT